MTSQQLVLRLAFGGLMLFQAYNSLLDMDNSELRDVNQAIGYYTGRFDILSDAKHVSNLDSLIQNFLAMLSLWAGITILSGYGQIGSLLAMSHSLLALLFTSNVWTPKIDQDAEISNFLLVTSEFFMSLIVLLDLQAEIPGEQFKDQ